MPGYPTTLGDLIASYNTNLSPQDEAAFQQYMARTGQGVGDYDLRGSWKAGIRPNERGHLPDTWKKPNSPTFSEESKYSTPDHTGGRWIPIDPESVPESKRRWVFVASPWNMSNMGAGKLSDYFTQEEPNSQIVLPINYDLGGR